MARTLAASVLVSAACGEPPLTPSPPTPSGASPGGVIAGRYVLELKPAARCQAITPPTVSFPVTGAEAGREPHPGAQVLLDASDPGLLELELKYVDFTLEGGVGTTENAPPLADDGREVWVSAIASGFVTQAADGRGQVLAGVLRGSLEIEGMSACVAMDHGFSLRPR